jgi:hypothetical protein
MMCVLFLCYIQRSQCETNVAICQVTHACANCDFIVSQHGHRHTFIAIWERLEHVANHNSTAFLVTISEQFLIITDRRQCAIREQLYPEPGLNFGLQFATTAE